MNNGQGEGLGRWLSAVPLRSPQREESGLRTPTGRDAPLCEGREGGFSLGLSMENREGAPSVAHSPGARSDAEETLLKWQEELGSGAIQGLESNACAALLSQKKEVLGLHRVNRGERGKDSDSEETESNTPTCQEDFGPRTTRTSTTISKVVDYIGKRIQEVHTEMITPRSMHAPDSDGVNNPDHVQQIVFPPAAQRQDREELKPEGTGGEGAGCSPQPGLLTARSGSQTARHQIVPKTALPFLFARVDSVKSEQPQLQDSEIENVDQNAVVEWWSNLIHFKPGAPSRQARLIRETHTQLAQMLIKKDARLESLYTQTIGLERSFKAAEIFSRNIVAELEVTRTALMFFCETENQYLTASGRESAEMSVQHAHELADLRKRLDDAHATELQELNSKLLEEAHLKEEALKREVRLLDEEAQLQEANRNTSDSVKKFLGDLREKDGELDKMLVLIAEKDKAIQLLLQQKETELKWLQQTNEAELKFIASEHLLALKSKDAELLRELEALSKAKLVEAETTLARHATELHSKEREYEASLAKKDVKLEKLVKKHIGEMDEGVAKHRAELRKTEVDNAAMMAIKDVALEELDKTRLAEHEQCQAAKDALEEKYKTDTDCITAAMSKQVDELRCQLRAKGANSDDLERRFEESRDAMHEELGDKEKLVRELTSTLQNAQAERDRTTLEIDKEKIERKIAQDENDHLTKKLQAQLEDLERLLESSGRQATAEVASLYSQIEQLLREIERLQGLLDAETARRLELAVTLRLAEESIRRAKLVGIGMRITDEAPHRITEIVAGGAAHMSGALQVGDYILEVAQMDASSFSIAEIRNFIVGPIGSYLELRLDRRGEDEESHEDSNVFTVKIKRAELTAGANIATTVHTNTTTQHKVGSSTSSLTASMPEHKSKPTALPAKNLFAQKTPTPAATPAAMLPTKPATKPDTASPDISGGVPGHTKKTSTPSSFVPGPFF